MHNTQFKKTQSFFNTLIVDYLLVPQRFFLIMALLFGLPMLFLRPAYDVPDAWAHLARAYAISQGQLVPHELSAQSPQFGMTPLGIKGFNYVGSTLPKDVAMFAPDNKSTDILNLYTLKRDTTPVLANYNTVSIYNPLSYAPQALSLLVGRTLGLSLYAGVVLASGVNFVLWLWMLTRSIKISPIGKWVIVVIGLLPMTIFLAPSISTDPLLIGTIILFFAYLAKLANDKRTNLTVKDVLPLILLSFVLSILKQTYFVLVFGVILLVHKFASKRQLYISLALCILPALVVVLTWTLITNHLNFVISPQSQPHQQIHLALTHPLHPIKVITKTLVFNSDGVVWSFFGFLGWLTILLPLWIIVSLGIVLALSFSLDATRFAIKTWQKLFFAALLVGNLLLIIGALYVYWTPVGSSSLTGLQGRYFIPLTILLAPIVVKFRISKESRTKAILFSEVLLFLCLATTEYILATKYF